MKRRLFFVFALMLLVFMFSSVAALEYMESDAQYTQPGFGSGIFTSSLTGMSRDVCEQGQDFIVQIAPFGCSPPVVRTDLLEEQDVAVWCQLMTTKLNPLVTVDAIYDIGFDGKFPKEVSSVEFHPALGALRVEGDVNNPLSTNIGYAVIKLTQQRNSSATPDFVEGELIATLRYDIKNAFGLGSSTFYLPELSEKDFEDNKNEYSFWKGKGYLRAEDISADSAQVSIYDSQRKQISVNLEKGKTSDEIRVPGFECLASLTLKLQELAAPDTRARLDVNGDIVELAKGEYFLDGKCYIRDVKKNGVTEEAVIKCEGEDEFRFYISPKIKLKICEKGNCTEKDYELGDKLYQSSVDKNKNVYLGFIGTFNLDGKEILYVRLFETSKTDDKLSADDIAKVARYDDYFTISKDGSLIRKIGEGVITAYIGETLELKDAVVNGEYYKFVRKGEKPVEFGGKSVEVIKYADPYNVELDKESKVYYENALQDYDRVLSNFANTRYESTNTFTKGEQAFAKKIELAYNIGQRKSVVDFCEEFTQQYPNSPLYSDVEKYCTDLAMLASSGVVEKSIVIDGKLKEISFKGIYEPSEEDYSAVIVLSRVPDICAGEATLQHNEETCFSENEVIRLKDLTSEYAEFDVSSVKESAGRENFWKTNTLKIKVGETQYVGINNYGITLKEINLKKVAKISLQSVVNNQESKANFSFKIGIEKRGIQLAPDEIRKKIASLDKSIEKWESISSKLGKVVKGMKAACFGVGAYLTVKNFLANTQGKSIARQNVMRGANGWYDICENETQNKKELSVEKCLTKYSDKINNDVDSYFKCVEDQQNKIKSVQKGLEEGSFFTGKQVNTEKLKEEYLKQFGDDIGQGVRGKYTGKEINMDKLIASFNINKISFEQIRDLELNLCIFDKSSELTNMASNRLNTAVGDIYASTKEEEAVKAWSGQSGFPEGEAHYYSFEKNKKEIKFFQDVQFKQIQERYTEESRALIDIEAHVQNNKDPLTGVRNIFVLDADNVVVKTFEVVGEDDKHLLILEDKGQNPLGIQFTKIDASAYNNEYLSSIGEIEPVVRYFETEPYKGQPAIIPVDLEKGWYISVRQVLPSLGEIKSYDESGALNSFYICNVGPNKKEENRGGDDDCQSFVKMQGKTDLYGIKDGDKFLENVQEAHIQAKQAYKAGVKTVKILGKDTKVGKPAVDVPDLQCQDFMSPSDCKLLFNVCDPVICPSSRCDLGGKYTVTDVVQSGIIGSIALCMPNFIGFGGDVYIPVCLTGIKAGLDGFLSVQKDYRKCLQTNLDTGETVGICDEIHSIYLCELFWRHGIDFAKLAIPKLLEFLFGQSVRGGGEYLSVENAWETAQQSTTYFTQYYAENAFNAFKARSTEEVGGEVCKVFVSGVYPASGDVLDSLTEPDSPPQFFGKFDEIPFTTATNPPISHYKVYYHIFAGNDRGAYYKVYLREAQGSSFYQGTQSPIYIAGGYIAAGKSVDETPDFTAASGYKELCIMVNDYLECGFKQVSTDFALDYIRDKYVADQATQEDIKTYKECIGGSMSLYALLNPNIQEGVDEAASPEIYNRGLVRICSTTDPSQATDTRYVSGETPRWVPVGYCDDKSIICWLDTISVENAIEMDFIAEGDLKNMTDRYLELLKTGGSYLTDDEFRNNVSGLDNLEDLKTIEDLKNRIKLLNTLLNKVYKDYQKGHLLYLRGKVYANLALDVYWETGLKCEKDEDCYVKYNLLGYECDTGRCMKTGFSYCEKDEDCLMGYECDTKRKTCVRNEELGCIDDSDCPTGFVCDVILGECKEKGIPLEDYFKMRSSEELVLILDQAVEEGILASSCKDYLEEAVEVTMKYNLPDPLLLIAMMQRESSCNAEEVSSGGDVGLMQINPVYWCGKYGLPEAEEDCVQALKNPNRNLDIAAQILKSGYDNYASDSQTVKYNAQVDKSCDDSAYKRKYKGYTGWERALRAYNGFGCSSGVVNYVENVLNLYEKLVGAEVVAVVVKDNCGKCGNGLFVLCGFEECHSLGETCYFDNTGIIKTNDLGECYSCTEAYSCSDFDTDSLFNHKKSASCEKSVCTSVARKGEGLECEWNDEERKCEDFVANQEIEEQYGKNILNDIKGEIFCEDCGNENILGKILGGWFDICDEKQCGAIKIKTGRDCIYSDGDCIEKMPIGISKDVWDIVKHKRRCEDCDGGGWFGVCREPECLALRQYLNKNCVYEDIYAAFAGGQCIDRGGEVTMALTTPFQTDFIMATGDPNLYDEQIRDADPDLIALLNCVNEVYYNNYGSKITVTSITNNALYDGSCNLNNPNEFYEDSTNCVHKKSSCHYHRENGILQSQAADLKTKNGYDSDKLIAAVDTCGAIMNLQVNPILENKGTDNEHLHVSIKGCDEGQATSAGDSQASTGENLPDLTVKITEIEPDPPVAGKDLFISNERINIGNVDVDQKFAICSYLDGHLNEKFDDNDNGEYDVWKNWVAMERIVNIPKGIHTIKIIVDCSNVIEESNEDNNEDSVTVNVTG